MNWMRILRVAARLVMCGSSVSMSWRAAKTILPPGFACAYTVSGATRRSSTTASVLMVVSSRAELVGRVRDRPGGRDQIFQGNALVRRRPLLVDADVARAVLHGGDPVRHQDVAVADVAEAAPAADDGRGAGGEPLSFGERGDEGMVRLHLHRILEPAILRAVRGDRHLGVEGGMVLLDVGEETLHVGAHRLERLTRHRPELEDHLALAARHARIALLVVVLLVHRVERVRREAGQLGVRGEPQPPAGLDRIEARPDAPHDLGLLLDRVHVLRLGCPAVAEEELGTRRLVAHLDGPYA